MKIWYFESIHRDESNDILYGTIYLCVLVEKYGQSNLGQNFRFSNVSTIAGRKEYYFKILLCFYKKYRRCKMKRILTRNQYIFPLFLKKSILCLFIFNITIPKNKIILFLFIWIIFKGQCIIAIDLSIIP